MQNKENKGTQENSNRKWIYSIVALFCVIAAIIIAILFFLNGETKTSNNGAEIKTTKSISCNGSSISYPFTGVASNNNSIKLDTILENDKLSTVSLTYQLPVAPDMNEKTKTNITITINKTFTEAGLEHDALNATFSSLSDSVQMTLYAKSKEVTSVTAKYFLLENANGKYDKNSIVKILEEKGLSCKVND